MFQTESICFLANNENLIGEDTTRPAYMDVPKYRKCTGKLQGDQTASHCKPLEQPADCPDDSWIQLYGENGVALNFTDCEGLSSNFTKR